MTSVSPIRTRPTPVIIGLRTRRYGPSTTRCRVGSHGASVPSPSASKSAIVWATRTAPAASSTAPAITGSAAAATWEAPADVRPVRGDEQRREDDRHRAGQGRDRGEVTPPPGQARQARSTSSTSPSRPMITSETIEGGRGRGRRRRVPRPARPPAPAASPTSLSRSAMTPPSGLGRCRAGSRPAHLGGEPASVEASPKTKSSSGIGAPIRSTGLVESAITTKRSAAAATIFSRVWAPPPPLTSQRSGATWSAPSIARSRRSSGRSPRRGCRARAPDPRSRPR